MYVFNIEKDSNMPSLCDAMADIDILSGVQAYNATDDVLTRLRYSEHSTGSPWVE